MQQIDLEALEVTQIKERIVAIVKFGPAGFKTDGFRPGEYFQVTVDPSKISPSGDFIRFGLYQGDEVTGWQRCKAISVVEVLGAWPSGDETPLLEYGLLDGITVLDAKQDIKG